MRYKVLAFREQGAGSREEGSRKSEVEKQCVPNSYANRRKQRH
ncbi:MULTISPECIES: hypothetical protein [unclassified Moorena]|nr:MULTISPECIES: hypothetical protein [unclassified Moorena]